MRLVFSQQSGQGEGLAPVFFGFFRKAASLRAGIEFVPDEAGSLRQLDWNAVSASQQGSGFRGFQQIVVERNRLRTPFQFGDGDDGAQDLARGQDIDTQPLYSG